MNETNKKLSSQIAITKVLPSGSCMSVLFPMSPKREQKVGVRSQEHDIPPMNILECANHPSSGGSPLGLSDLRREFSLGEDQMGETIIIV